MLVRVCGCLAVLVFLATAGAAELNSDLETLKSSAVRQFSSVQPLQWGETVTGVKTRLATDKPVLALTLDGCGGAKGKGVDSRLMEFLIRENIPATLFVNARWIDANLELFLLQQ